MEDPIVYESYFDRYTSLVEQKDLQQAFSEQTEIINAFLSSITEEKSTYSYAEGKWTLKEMLQHMIDTERIFAYRALSIARKELAVLPGFDENTYAANSFATNRSWADLAAEMKIVRESTVLLFDSFTEEMLQTIGYFSTTNSDVKTIGQIIIGHFYHHVKVAHEKYLN